jgi:hypothetical protein
MSKNYYKLNVMTRKGNVDIITHRNPELTSQLSPNNLPIITEVCAFSNLIENETEYCYEGSRIDEIVA